MEHNFRHTLHLWKLQTVYKTVWKLSTELRYWKVHGKKSHGNVSLRCSGIPIFCLLLCSHLSPRSLFQTAQSAYRQRRLSCGFK